MELDLNDCQLINLARIAYIAGKSLTTHPMDDAFLEQYSDAFVTAAEAGLPVEDMTAQYLEANS